MQFDRNGKPFTLDQLFSDASKAKEQLIKELTSFLQDKKLEQEKIDQVVKGFSDQDLSAWNFDYKDSQIILYPSQSVENLERDCLASNLVSLKLFSPLIY